MQIKKNWTSSKVVVKASHSGCHAAGWGTYLLLTWLEPCLSPRRPREGGWLLLQGELILGAREPPASSPAGLLATEFPDSWRPPGGQLCPLGCDDVVPSPSHPVEASPVTLESFVSEPPALGTVPVTEQTAASGEGSGGWVFLRYN